MQQSEFYRAEVGVFDAVESGSHAFAAIDTWVELHANFVKQSGLEETAVEVVMNMAKVCPQCGSEYEGKECPFCGYVEEEPKEELKEEQLESEQPIEEEAAPEVDTAAPGRSRRQKRVWHATK